MIKAESIEALQELLEKSRAKAEQMNPIFVMVAFRHFQIEGKSKGIYDVFLGKNPNGEFWVGCNCRAGLERKNCYHAFVALREHLAFCKRQAKAADKDAKNQMDNAPYLKEGSKEKPDTVGGYRV